MEISAAEVHRGLGELRNNFSEHVKNGEERYLGVLKEHADMTKTLAVLIEGFDWIKKIGYVFLVQGLMSIVITAVTAWLVYKVKA